MCGGGVITSVYVCVTLTFLNTENCTFQKKNKTREEERLNKACEGGMDYGKCIQFITVIQYFVKLRFIICCIIVIMLANQLYNACTSQKITKIIYTTTKYKSQTNYKKSQDTFAYKTVYQNRCDVI